jgi:cellulose synthase operon protein B
MIMVNRVKAARVALLIGLGAALHPAPAASAEQSATELKVIPLRTVDNQGGQLELRGQAGQLQFRVPVEAGAKVRDARLRLVYQSADSVRSERSRMWVYLNQQGIAQLPLNGDGDAVRADIVLPPDLLTAGQNTLSLWAQQEGGQGCDAGSSAALWTRLDPGNSYLALETAGPDRERDLADLVDATSFIGAGSERIELLTPASPTEGGLKAGALVAQGFALRMPDSGIAVRHRLADAQALAGRNGKVVVGTADKIRAVPGIDDLPEVQGPYIGLRPIQGAGPVLIVSGRTDAEVLKAALAFADPSVALPAAMDWNVDAVRLAVPWKRTMQEPGGSYRFKELRAISGGISNGTEARTGLELNLPADTLPAGARKVLLELDYSYAQNLAPNSVVNVLVNGNYASMIALNDPRGETVGKHRVALPVDRFRPGMNTIAFEPMIGSDSSTGCLVRPGTGRSIAISGDSTITIPDMARVASLPDLQLFASGGFPYVGTTDPRAGSQRNFEVLLTGSDSGTIGGAWTLLAKLARTAGHPIANFAIGPKAGYQGDVLMIGPADGLDDRIAADLPSAARHVHDAMRPAGGLFQPGSPPRQGLQSSLEPGLPPDPASVRVSPSVIKASIADARLVAEAFEWSSRMSRTFQETLWPSRYTRTGATSLGPIDEHSAMMAAFESPVKPQSTITVITANTGEDLEAGIASLVRPALWDRLSGGTVAWDAGSMSMRAWPAEDNYRMGDIPDDWRQRILFVNAVFARNPVAWALLALAGLFVLSGLTHVALNKRQGS